MNPSLQPASQWSIPTAVAATARPPLMAVQKLLLPLGVFLFDWLVWRERGGVNMLVFYTFIVVAQLVQLPPHAAARHSGYFRLIVFGSLLVGGLMAIYGSAVAVMACSLSVLLLLGYVNQPSLKLLLYMGLTGLGSAAEAWLRVLRGVRAPRPAGARWS